MTNISESSLQKTFKKTETHCVKIGNVIIGGDNPVVIQSMTNTDTSDTNNTVSQIIDLVQAGSEMVRVTVNNNAAAIAIPIIKNELAKQNIEIPIIGDFHFNGHKLLNDHPECAESLDKYRINPGNVGKGDKHDIQFSSMIEIACKYNKPVRIGVNWGSLDQELLAKMLDKNARLKTPLNIHAVTKDAVIVSALESAEMANNIGLENNKIILSCKMSNVLDLIDVYRNLSSRTNLALHLGLTEAGMGNKGIVASSTAIGILLNEGIGNTIRVSLTPSPNGNRNEEVLVAQEILQALDLRSFAPSVTSCPGCGRTQSNKYLLLADNIQKYVTKNASKWRLEYPGSELISIAVMGCIVNGPGESKHANIGISLPGLGETDAAPVFINGKKSQILKGGEIDKQFIKIIEAYIKHNHHYSNI